MGQGIETVAGRAMSERVTRGLKEPTGSTKPAAKAEWAREVIARTDALLPEEQRRAIVELCRCRESQAGIEHGCRGTSTGRGSRN
ncbi:hypothetical protein LLH03_14300 [bacterium]|nr:hypothetical protein [bacterium]